MTLIGDCKNLVIEAPFHNASVDMVNAKAKALPKGRKRAARFRTALMPALKVSSQTQAIGP